MFHDFLPADPPRRPTSGARRPPRGPAAATTGTGSSALTGWAREDWARLADRMLAAVRPFASPGHGRIMLPGAGAGAGGHGHGRAVDGLEGFARTFLLAGFRLAGECGADPDDLAGWYAQGLRAGSDPSAPDRWVRLAEHGQAKVEAAALVLVLDMTRPWIWDRLDGGVQERLVDYLAPAVGDRTYPQINWVWFRLVVQTFLRSVGGPWSAGDIAEDLATHDSFVRSDGWLADGPERSFDHYNGWALHLYPLLWARMAGAQGFAEARRQADVARLDRFLLDAVALVGADGSPLLQGRSLTYRFAAAAPFWVGAIAEVPSLPPGLLRRAASGVVRHFVDRGAPDEDGLLTLGWHHAWPAIAQSYSGPASPYWASKGLLGLALPADHPAWTAPEQPLPVERQDTVLAVRAPGWLVVGTRDDGIVRVVNHGTDHAAEGTDTGDSPLYARLGYSTATSPLLDDASWADPLDQSVVLLAADGRATHRAGMRTLTVEVQDTAAGPLGIGASCGPVRWLAPAPSQRRHGSGFVGTSTAAGRITVVSLVRGRWEVRLVRVDALAATVDAATTLRVAGWAVAAPDATAILAGGGVTASAAGTVSRISPLRGAGVPGATRRSDASPLANLSVVPWLRFPVPSTGWTAALVELARGAGAADPGRPARLDIDGRAGTARVRWPDGADTTTHLAVKFVGEPGSSR
ncbi:MAG TPA: DUF2264 domain-containing protein [Pilimelia sp.]|nr:DUF2264 domain-containing protein [Pilimelia sp.]